MTGCSQKTNDNIRDASYIATIGTLAVGVVAVTAPVTVPLMTSRYIIEKETINKKYQNIHNTKQLNIIHASREPDNKYKYGKQEIWEYDNLLTQDTFDVTIQYDIYILIEGSDVLSYSRDLEDIKDWEKFKKEDEVSKVAFKSTS